MFITSEAFPFTKMHGAGNDFVVLDALAHPVWLAQPFSLAAQELCARGFGVGADGLLLLMHANNGDDFQMRMWNPDGSEDMCGNGLRCLAHLAHLRGYIGDEFGAQTLSGSHRGKRLSNGEFSLQMGAPQFDFAQIPLQRSLDFQGDSALNYSLGIENNRVGPLSSLSTGSTHTVLWSDAETIEKHFLDWSPKLEIHPAFPERSSILWAQVLADNRIELRIWERGVGETLACGTGACATAVAAIETGRINSDEVIVASKGGDLRVQWRRGEENLAERASADCVRRILGTIIDASTCTG